MKTANNDLIDFLASQSSRKIKCADLYTFTLTNGTVLRYTSADFDINHNGNIYSHKNAGIARSEMSWQQGLSVDDVTIEMNPAPTDKIGKISLVEAFRNGTFDGAELTLDMAFYSEGWEKEPLILADLFVGNVDVEEVSGSYVKLNIKSLTELLNTSFPANIYQASCNYALYCSSCGVAKANYSENGLVQSGSTKKQIYCQLMNKGGYYQNGVIQFKSGENLNVKKSVKIHSSGLLTLSTPLQYTPKTGDSFIVSAGCDRTMTTCKQKFNNIDNFSGTPFIPKADSSL